MENFAKRIEIDLSPIEVKQVKKDCQGQVYRFAYDQWIGSSGDVNFRYRFRPVASLSCSGCESCDWIYDDLREQLGNGWDYMRQMYDNVKPGKLYRLKMIDYSTDWETGYIDDYTIGFEEIKE